MYSKLNEMLKEAIRNKDEDTKNYIRSIRSKITEYCVASNINRNETPNNELVVKVISSHKKSLEKAIKQLKRGGEKSIPLIDEYNKEILFCEQFLPDEKEIIASIEKVVEEVIKEVGNDTGKVMGNIMKNYNFDGKIVKSVVMTKLNG